MVKVADVAKRLQADQAEHKARVTPSIFAYRPCIVTFIDILGFKAMVAKMTASRIGDALTLLGRMSDGDNKDDAEWPSGLSRTITFSDSVVRACPIDGDDPSGSFFMS